MRHLTHGCRLRPHGCTAALRRSECRGSRASSSRAAHRRRRARVAREFERRDAPRAAEFAARGDVRAREDGKEHLWRGTGCRARGRAGAEAAAPASAAPETYVRARRVMRAIFWKCARAGRLCARSSLYGVCAAAQGSRMARGAHLRTKRLVRSGCRRVGILRGVVSVGIASRTAAALGRAAAVAHAAGFVLVAPVVRVAHHAMQIGVASSGC